MPINAAAFRKRVSAGISDALELLDEARFISLSTFTFTLVLWRISYYTVDALLNTKDGEEKDKLIILWRENKIQELNVIFISVSVHYPWFVVVVFVYEVMALGILDSRRNICSLFLAHHSCSSLDNAIAMVLRPLSCVHFD